MHKMNRKEIVAELETKWGVKAKYLGAPTFAYEVGDYRVDQRQSLDHISTVPQVQRGVADDDRILHQSPTIQR